MRLDWKPLPTFLPLTRGFPCGNTARECVQAIMPQLRRRFLCVDPLLIPSSALPAPSHPLLPDASSQPSLKPLSLPHLHENLALLRLNPQWWWCRLLKSILMEITNWKQRWPHSDFKGSYQSFPGIFMSRLLLRRFCNLRIHIQNRMHAWMTNGHCNALICSKIISVWLNKRIYTAIQQHRHSEWTIQNRML